MPMSDRHSGLIKILGLAAAAALFFLLRKIFPSLGTALLILGGIVSVLLLALVVVVIFFAFHQPEEKRFASDGENDAYTKGRAALMGLRRLTLRIRNKEICTLSGEICRKTDRILAVLKDCPEKISCVRQFFTICLPAMNDILEKYRQVEAAGIPTAELTGNVVACLGTVRTAAEKQYDGLFAGDLLDLSAEKDTLMAICRRDGLLTDSGKIDLTL